LLLDFFLIDYLDKGYEVKEVVIVRGERSIVIHGGSIFCIREKVCSMYISRMD